MDRMEAWVPVRSFMCYIQFARFVCPAIRFFVVGQALPNVRRSSEYVSLIRALLSIFSLKSFVRH